MSSLPSRNSPTTRPHPPGLYWLSRCVRRPASANPMDQCRRPTQTERGGLLRDTKIAAERAVIDSGIKHWLSCGKPTSPSPTPLTLNGPDHVPPARQQPTLKLITSRTPAMAGADDPKHPMSSTVGLQHGRRSIMPVHFRRLHEAHDEDVRAG